MTIAEDTQAGVISQEAPVLGGSIPEAQSGKL